MVGNTPRRPFVLVANHIVLDFVNTVNARPSFTRDDLTSVDDLVEWACVAGLIPEWQSLVGTAEGTAQPDAAKTLRENLYRVFGPIAAGDDPQPAALAFVANRAAAAVLSTDWIRGDFGYVPHWSGDTLESICGQLADEAVRLLRSEGVRRVGACAGCGWLFLDTSRAHARRWCSMDACGVRDKMRRYHQRQTLAARVS